MTFTLRPSTVEITNKLIASYYRNPKIALLTVKTGGGKTYGAIHTFGKMFKKCTLLVFTTDKVAKSKQWQTSVTDYNNVMHTQLKIICNNYEKLLAKGFLNELAEKLTLVEHEPIVLILDEIHRIKLASNGKVSQRAQILTKLSREPYITTVLGLSATAFSNSYLDVANYLVMAGYYRSKTEFLNTHVKRFNDYYQPIVKDDYGNISRNAFRNPDQIDYEINQITSYVDTSNYTPKLTTSNEKFKLTNPQKAKYNDIMIAYDQGEYDQEMKDGSVRPCWMCARSDQEGLLANEFASPKDMFLLNLLKRQQNNEFDGIHPILVFYEYTVVCNHLKNLLKYAAADYDVVLINGSSNVSEKDLAKPKNDKSIYLVQYEAGGEGLDWQWSNISVFYEAPVWYEKFVQAQGRNMRNKSLMAHVYHFNLEYEDTCDAERWSTNRAKKNFTKDVSKRTFLKQAKSQKRLAEKANHKAKGINDNER